MRITRLLQRNLTYYWRTNLAVLFGVGAAVAVLAGALLVGDSVRASLRDLFLERLGKTDHIITASGFFHEKLTGELESHEGFASGGFTNVCPLIVLEGSVTHQDNGRRAAGIQVYGVDERFWKFHEKEALTAPRDREILSSTPLAQELGTKAGDSLLLRVEKPSAIPVESLHGRKEDTGRTIRLNVREALPGSALGEFSVRPQQAAVRAVFVPLKLLQKELEQENKVNTILVAEKASGDVDRNSAASSAKNAPRLEKILRDKISLEDMGIKLRVLEEQRAVSLENESALLNDSLTETAGKTAAELGLRTQPVLTYLANSIRSGQREIPYSLVTAFDDESLAKLKDKGTGTAERSSNINSAPGSDEQSSSQLAPIILNDWAARDLNVQPGGTVSLEYYLWQEDGRLLTRTAQFRLAGVVPIEGAAADRNLVPEYPGITGTESLSDWDPPFPVDLERVRAVDEDYWDEYRTTPKAFIPLSKGQELWQSRFGKLTSLRVIPADGTQLQSAFDSYRKKLRDALDPTQMGLRVYAARAQGLEASQGATDFGEYFLYFSFFLVISSLLLTSLFFKLGVEQRLREIGILQATGFPAARIRQLFLCEGILLASLGSLVGLAGALAYGKLMMLGLSTWWVGATGTTLLKLHVSSVSLMIGGAGGVLAALGCIIWTLKRLSHTSTRSLLTGSREERGKGEGRKKGHSLLLSFTLYPFSLPLFFGLLGMALLLAAALGLIAQVAGFFGGGTLLLIALLCYQAAWLRRDRRKLIRGNGWWSVSRLGFRNATHRPGRSVLCIALIASAAFIIVAVDAFRRGDRSSGGDDVARDRKSGGGGFRLLAESLLPVVHDPNTAEGREALNLASESDAAVLEGIAFTRFRVRPGDDASCLNLYQPRNPRILAPTPDFVNSGRFTFQDSLAATTEEKSNPWLLLNAEAADGAIPVIADANSLTYVLKLKTGDEFLLSRSGSAGPVRLRIVGALSDSIFQGEFLMSEKNFLRLFPEQAGFRFFLLDVPAREASAITGILEDRLSDFGFDVASTDERLANFHRVENTFISTFQMLGGLGLVLGTLGLSAVLLRNVLERRRELALLRAVGYNSTAFAVMVIAENAFLLFCGLLTGAVCALLAIAPVLFSRGGQLPVFSLGLLLLSVLVSGLVASLLATAAALRSPLLPALRAE